MNVALIGVLEGNRKHEIDIEKTRMKRIKRSQQQYGIVWYFGTIATWWGGGVRAVAILKL